MMPYVLIIPILGIVGGCAVIITAMNLLSRHFSRRATSELGSMPSDEIMRRLERIEQIVDSTAVEVERLAESNRFVAKLLAERSQTPSA
jgi:hypothetical protein